jgi:prenyltransferase beta subunit
MLARQRFILGLLLGCTVLGLGTFALLGYSQDALPQVGGQLLAAQVGPKDQDAAPDVSTGKDLVTPQTQAAIDKALEYLKQCQGPNGEFGASHFQGNVAITALAGLAFMSAGNQPGRGKYGAVVTDALRYVLNQEQNVDMFNRATPGYLYHRSNKKQLQHGAMYEHGFGTLFLAEVYGMVYDKDLRERLDGTLRRAVQLIIRSQNMDGGWRYSPFAPDADLSVTICQIMALRAARNAGISVPGSVSKKCIDYVKSCQLANRGGAFHYMKQGGHISFPLTAAGIVALYSAGVYQDQAIVDGLEYLKKFKPAKPGQPAPALPHDIMFPVPHYYYGHYYAAQAMWIVGGKYWREWYPLIRDELLSRQVGGRYWDDQKIDPHYCTAMALLVLQMPNNYLPIFQR